MPQGKETVSDEQILDAMRQHPDPFFAATEIGEMFDHSRQWAHGRLQSLRDEGLVIKKKKGPRSVIWWVAGAIDCDEPP